MRENWRRAARAVSEAHPLVILSAAWLLAVLYAYPGYMNWDSGDQLYWARTRFWDDWHPPVMARYWRVIEMFVRGPFGMLVVQLTLFLAGMYAALRTRFQPRTAAFVAGALLVFPPLLTPMAAVWKDAQMAGWLLAGTMCMLQPSWRWRSAGVVMLVLACGVRDNAFTALPSLCLLFAARWGLRRKLAVIGAAFAMFVAITATATLLNRALTTHHSYPWYKSGLIQDLAGTLCLADPMTDDQVRDALADIPTLIHSNLQYNLCKDYDPRWWFPLTFGDNDFFLQMPDKPDRLARKHAWFRVIREHPYEYLSHRWLVMRELLGLTDENAHEPVCQTFAANPDQLQRVHHDTTLSWYQFRLGRAFVWMATTILFRPWAYLLGCMVLAVYALRRRDGFVLALVTSGISYELMFFIMSPGPEYRYSHWMISCCCLAIAIVFGERWRAGRRAATEPMT